MPPEMYRKQFIAFIKLLYPNGVPPGVNCVTFSDSFKTSKMKFYFDKNDLDEDKNIVLDTKKAKKKADVKFDESLSEEDILWLKSMDIIVRPEQLA